MIKLGVFSLCVTFNKPKFPRNRLESVVANRHAHTISSDRYDLGKKQGNKSGIIPDEVCIIRN